MSRVLHHIRLKTALAVLLMLAACPPGRAAGPAPEQGPQQIIRHFQDTLIAAMKAGKQAGYGGRYRLLKPVIEETHDLEAIARVSLGQAWSQLSAAQRSAFVDTFSQLSIATYAAQFNAYSGESFSDPDLVKQSGDRAVVHSDFIQSDGEKVSFTYQLRAEQGKWRIVNIIANGVSDLAMKRAEYSGIIRDSGFDALLKQLQQKIDQYRNQNSE